MRDPPHVARFTLFSSSPSCHSALRAVLRTVTRGRGKRVNRGRGSVTYVPFRPSFSPSIPLRETSERSERDEQERNETEWVSWVVSLWSFPSLPTPFRLVTLASRSERMRGRRNRVSEWGERGETRPLRSVHRFPTSYFGPDSLVSPPRLGSSHVMLGSLRSPHIPFVSPSRRRGGGNGRDRRWDGWDYNIK